MPQQGEHSTGEDRNGETKPDDLFRRLIRNISILATGEGMNGLLSLAYTVFAVRVLGVEGFGFLVLIHIYTLMAGEFIKFPTVHVILRMGTQALVKEKFPELQRLIVLTTIIDLICALVAVFVAIVGIVFVGPIIGLPDALLPSATLYCASVFFITPSTPLGLLRMWRRVDLLALRSVLGSLTRLVGALIFFFLGGDVIDFLVVWFAATLVSSSVLLIGGWREAMKQGVVDRSNFSLRVSSSEFPGIWKLLWANHLNGAAAMGTFRIGTLVVGGLLGSTEAGLYRIAANIAEIGAQAGKLFNPAFYPELARLVADNNLTRLRQLLGRSMLLALLASVLFLIIIRFAGTPLLRLFGGEEATPAFYTLILLTGAQLILMSVFPIEPTLISVGEPLAALWSRLIMGAVYLPLLPVFVSWQGLEGAALALMVGHFVVVVAQATQLQWWFAKHHRF